MMPMIFSMRMEHISGLREKGSTIPTPTEQDVLFPRPSHPTLQKDFPWWSVNRAKDYISGALAAMLDLGKGSGPMDHGFAVKNSYTEEA